MQIDVREKVKLGILGALPKTRATDKVKFFVLYLYVTIFLYMIGV